MLKVPELGLHIPRNLGIKEGNPEDFSELARRAEELGFGFCMVLDHSLLQNETQSDQANLATQNEYALKDKNNNTQYFLDPFIQLTAIALATTKMELFTGVSILSRRSTIDVANAAATLDFISKGRLRLGVGAGWNEAEFEASAFDYHRRGQRLNEQIIALRRIWTEEVVDVHVSGVKGGEEEHIYGGISPRPRQLIPIWVGGLSKPAIDRAVQLGDGYLADVGPDTFEDKHIMQIVKECSIRRGRETEFPIQGLINLAKVPEDKWMDNYRRLKQMGVTHIALSTTEGNSGRCHTVDEHLALISEMKRRIDIEEKTAPLAA